MTQSNTDNQVALAGLNVDPLLTQNQQIGTNKPIDPSRRPSWIVQFVDTPEEATKSDLRSRFGLRLNDYVPVRSYLEWLLPVDALLLREDTRIRAVMLVDSNLKLSANLRDEHESNDPEDPKPTDVSIFDLAAEEVLAQIRSLVPSSQVLAILDDRGRGGGLVARLDIAAGTAAQIAGLDGVRWVDAVPQTVDDGEVDPDTSRIPAAERLGLTGNGQIVGIIDNGPPDIRHCFFADSASPQPGPAHRKLVMLRNAESLPAGKHATFTCGVAAGNGPESQGLHPQRGVAFGARLACGSKRDIDTTSTLFAELTAAADAGAYVHSNSWHSAPQGAGRPATYDQRSADLDLFVWLNEDHVVLGSSGNTGEEQGPPGTAKNALCVSARAVSGTELDTVGDGSTGPTSDGRLKPDITGLGCGVVSATVDTACDVGNGNVPCSSSRATPWVAGLLTLVRQQLTEGRHGSGAPSAVDAFVPTGAMLRAIALNAAVVGGMDPATPGLRRGWGWVDPEAALGQATPRALVDLRNAEGLSTGDSSALKFSLDQEARLAITLTWTEPPGTVGSASCVVNNLDLVVTAPTGEKFWGNNFKEGQSATGGGPDAINSTEMVVVEHATAGAWLIEVVATEVNVGHPKQGFALVVSGALVDNEKLSPGGNPVVWTRPLS